MSAVLVITIVLAAIAALVLWAIGNILFWEWVFSDPLGRKVRTQVCTIVTSTLGLAYLAAALYDLGFFS